MKIQKRGVKKGSGPLNYITLRVNFFKMAVVKSGDSVKVHYHGKLTNGETFDSSTGREPLQFKVGTGAVIKGFDEGVTGMSVGEKKTIHIPFLEAYGQHSPEMVIDMPKERFPADMEISVGMPLQMSDGQGRTYQVTITEIKETTVILDANHPLAGKDLVFDLELVEIEGGSSLIITP
jgi:FKBP-type peptidyl-prolyl cis-trans isomerase 2